MGLWLESRPSCLRGPTPCLRHAYAEWPGCFAVFYCFWCFLLFSTVFYCFYSFAILLSVYTQYVYIYIYIYIIIWIYRKYPYIYINLWFRCDTMRSVDRPVLTRRDATRNNASPTRCDATRNMAGIVINNNSILKQGASWILEMLPTRAYAEALFKIDTNCLREPTPVH